MSTTILRLIPSDPHYIPADAAQEAAMGLLERFLPEGEICEPDIYEFVTFIDQGENLESIICPACAKELKIDYFAESDAVHVWWINAISPVEEADGRVEGVEVRMPCCSAMVPFTSLRFHWPAGFARFALSVCDPNMDSVELSACDPPRLPEGQVAELERALGCRLIEIWCHY